MHTSRDMRKAFSIVRRIEELAADRANEDVSLGHFPRDIESLLLYTFEIPVIEITNLTLHSAEKYLAALRGDTAFQPRGQDRPLFGFVNVGPPVNLILLRHGLGFHIANYVLAHELAHFVNDVYIVQNLWARTLPDQVEAIRGAFSWENLDPLLELQAAAKGLPPRPHRISGRGQSLAADTSEREIQADLIAREILAPWDKAVEFYHQYGEQQVISAFRQSFGLPLRIAYHYYQDLRLCLNPPPSTVDRLFGPLLDKPRKE